MSYHFFKCHCLSNLMSEKNQNLVFYCQIVEGVFEYLVNNNNSTIRMNNQQEFIIRQQDQNEQLYYQEMIKQLEKQLPAQKQFDFVSLQTQQCELRAHKNIINFPQNQKYSLSSQNQEEEIIESNNQFLEILKQKLFISFTDYFQKCQQSIGNVQFQLRNLKRQRKSQLNNDLAFDILIQGNELMSCMEIKNMNKIIKQSKFLKKLMQEFMAKIEKVYQNQVVMCFYFILKHLKQNQQQKTPVYLLSNIQGATDEIVSMIKCCNKMNLMFFIQYSLDYEEYFYALISSWVEVIFNAQLNDDLPSYIQGIKDNEYKGETRSSMHFCFDFKQVDSDQENYFSDAPRKIKPTFY